MKDKDKELVTPLNVLLCLIVVSSIVCFFISGISFIWNPTETAIRIILTSVFSFCVSAFLIRLFNVKKDE